MKMKILDELREETELLELGSEHNGYWYSVSDVMIILVCGMLCKLEKIVDIATWARSTPTKKFLKDYFDIEAPSKFVQLVSYAECKDEYSHDS